MLLSEQIDQASFLLPREELIDPSSAKQDMAAYIAYITGTAKAIRDSLKSDATDAQIEQDVKDLWNFESELAKVIYCNYYFNGIKNISL